MPAASAPDQRSARPGEPGEGLLEAAEGLRIVDLDDDAVVFNPFSWETHVLNPAASLVLEMVAVQPCGLRAVTELLAESLTDAERPRAAEHAQRLISELVGLRLLVRRGDPTDAGC